MRASSVRPFSRVAAIFTCTLFLVAGQLPAHSLESGAAGRLGSFEPTIGKARIERFVDLWSKRIENGSFQAFLDAPGIPASIKAEGFHDVDFQTKGFLIQRLVDRLVRTVPSLERRIEAVGGHERIQVEASLYLFIFDKERVQAAQQEPDAPAPAPAEADKVPSDDLLARIDEIRSMNDVDVADPTAFVRRNAAPAETPQVRSIELGKGDPLPAQAIEPSITDILGMVIGLPTEYLQQSYRLCASPANVCSAPVNVNVPTTLDVNGDGIADVAGALQTLPDVSLVPNVGLRFQLSLERLAQSVRQHVYAALDLGPLRRRVTVGVDGRTAGIALHTVLGITLRNLLLPVPGQPDLHAVLDLRQILPAGEVSVTAGTATLPALNDPLLVNIRFGNVPDFTGEVIVRKNDLGMHIEYIATSALTLQASYNDASGQSILATLTNLPRNVTLDLSLGGATKTVVWSASAPITSIAVDAVLDMGGRRWNGGLRIDNVPAKWRADVGQNGALSFDTLGGPPIGSLSGYISNVGAVGALPPDNFASADFSIAEQNLLAAFRMNAIKAVSFLPGADGWQSRLQMGGGEPFLISAVLRDTVTNRRASLAATITPLPTDILIAQSGSSFTYQANDNLDLAVALDAGFVPALNVTPVPPTIHGLSARDGWACSGRCDYAVKLRLSLTGMPRAVSVNTATSTFSMDHFAPRSSVLGVDAVLDDLHNAVGTALPKVTLGLTQVLPIGTPLDITASFSQTNTATSKRTVVSYESTRAGTSTLLGLGALDVTAGIGPSSGILNISNIPGRVTATIDFLNGTTNVNIRLEPSGIQSFRARAFLDSIGVAAGVTLTDVPSVMNLSFGRQGDPNGVNLPGMSYSASASTLDISAFVDANLFGGSVQARVTFGVTNLGATTTATFNAGSRTLQVSSTPKTDVIDLAMWGRIHYGVDYGPTCIPSCGSTARIRIDNGSGGAAHAGIEPLTIDNLGFRFTNLQSFTLRLGVTSSMEGSYGSFTLGWDNMSVRLNVDARARGELQIGFTFSLTLVEVHIHINLPVNVVWHLSGNHLGVPNYSNSLFSWDTPIICGCHGFLCLDIDFYDVDIKLKPHAHSTATNRFTVTAATAEGGAWLVTPDPFGIIPDFAVFIIARFTSPLGGDQSVTFPCRD